MKKKAKNAAIRVIAALLAAVMMMPSGTDAAAAEALQPTASDYLSSCSGSVSALGGGAVRVNFSVKATGVMDELGAKLIQIYECDTNSSNTADWIWKISYKPSVVTGMLGCNSSSHSGSVTYQGTAGKYYRAYISVWCGRDGSGDTKSFWTLSKKCV